MSQTLPPKTRPFVLVLLILATIGAGCATTREAYYNAWEKLGYAKRDRLVDNVKSARDAQQVAQKQFATTLDEFKSVVHFNGGDLEAMYNKLNDAYNSSDSRASAVRSKIASVKHVGEALFTEWKGEIAQMEDDAALQKQSQDLFDKTHLRYDGMVAHMDSAAATMDPVLKKFKNRVLFIKANLNAAAIGSLQGTDTELGNDIDNLIKEMQSSINEADKFISQVSAK